MAPGTRLRARLNLKGRVGEALVENILRRAGYKVARVGRESQVQHMLRTGISEFLPDFLVWKPVDPEKETVSSLNRVFSVAVLLSGARSPRIRCERAAGYARSSRGP